MPSDLFFIAPEAGILQVWRLPANGRSPRDDHRTRLTDVFDYDISPDGTQIVYTSGGVLYRQVINSEDVTEIATISLEAPVLTTPAFSPSGRQIAYADGGIWVVDLDTGDSQLLVNDTPPAPEQERLVTIYTNPKWSPDGAWILSRVNYYEGFDYALLTPDERNVAPPTLELFVSDARWGDENTLIVFTAGGFISEPQLTTITPGVEPEGEQILSMAVLDARLRNDQRIAFLRTPTPYQLGPTSVRLFSTTTSGSDVQPEGPSFVLHSPQLAPGGVLVAGLLTPRPGEFGAASGQLAIVDPDTGEMFFIEGINDVRSLQWGGG